MAERALAKGASLVPPITDLLRLYSMRFCPYAQRTRMILQHKNVPHEVINVNLKHKPDWLLQRNPQGLVPVVEYKGHVMYESVICDEFIDDTFPEPRLMPGCPFEKASTKLLMHIFDQNVRAFYGLMSTNPEKRQTSWDNVNNMFAKYENTLTTRNTTYFGGERIGMLDFHVWPWFERLAAITNLRGSEVLSPASYPRLTQWINRMEQCPAVKNTRMPVDWHMQFLVSLAQRDPQYDIGLSDKSAKL